ncbi:MAG: response regulator [Alphaproteobacteria bacterium]|nr:response regulator [Alphaproteobacteria bacterium]
MDCSIIDTDAEDMLYALLIAEGQRTAGGNEKVTNINFLQCQFFHIDIKPDPSTFYGALKSLLAEAQECGLYFCTDGDVIIKWNGDNQDIRYGLVKMVTNMYETDIEKYTSIDDFFIDYDMINSRDKLKSECAKKLKKQSKHGKELSKYFSNVNLIGALQKTIHMIKMQRALRAQPQILIVEDQKFSQKILTTILKDYTCHVAGTSGEALLLYMEKCPDIVFLDIELPDLNGHQFARLVRNIDQDSYVVIVSGNQYEEDIKTAKENDVKGFISKPYEKEMILKVIEQFKRTRKRKVA